jgi:hypothetical protein
MKRYSLRMPNKILRQRDENFIRWTSPAKRRVQKIYRAKRQNGIEKSQDVSSVSSESVKCNPVEEPNRILISVDKFTALVLKVHKIQEPKRR